MTTLVQIDEARNNSRDFSSNDASLGMPVIQIARVNDDTKADLELSPRVDLTDALKILIRSLLDQLDYLTEPTASSDGIDSSLQAMVRRFETELIRQALLRTGGKQRQAARLLGEKKTTLNAKIIRYGIKVASDGAARRLSKVEDPTFRNQRLRWISMTQCSCHVFPWS